jgi:hypothetical protein
MSIVSPSPRVRSVGCRMAFTAGWFSIVFTIVSGSSPDF